MTRLDSNSSASRVVLLTVVECASGYHYPTDRLREDPRVGRGSRTIIARAQSPALTPTVLYRFERGREAGAMLIDTIERRRLRPTHTMHPVAFVAPGAGVKADPGGARMTTM